MKNLLLIALISIAFISCKKKEEESLTKPVTYTIYSESGNFAFGCVTADGDYYEEVTSQNNYTKTFEVTESKEQHSSGVSVVIQTTDSLFIRADYSGKTVSKGDRSSISGATLSVQIQLSEAK